MKSRPFSMTAAISLLLFVATLMLWARSYWRAYWIQIVDVRHNLRTSPDRIWFEYSDRPYYNRIPYRSTPLEDSFEAGATFNHFFLARRRTDRQLDERTYIIFGFVYFTYLQPQGRSLPIRFIEVGIPLWFISLCFAAVPAFWLRRQLTQIPPGHCPTCGYDLRATPQGGRCPECGAIPAKTKIPT